MKNPLEDTRKGAISWMVRHPVAANLGMIILLLGGLLTIVLQVKQEVFPEFTLDTIVVSVAYPGSGPKEIETGILVAIEEEVSSLDGVDEVSSSASQGSGSVTIELERDADQGKMLQDVQNAVDSITSLPERAERPRITLIAPRSEVISLIIYGDLPESTLRELAENVRDGLLRLPAISQVDTVDTRAPEIAVEIPAKTLRAYNLTMNKVAAIIRARAIELGGGSLKTPGGEILIRIDERRERAREFRKIPVIHRPDGTVVRLEDIATIRDDFVDNDRFAYFNGQRAVMVTAFRLGDETPTQVATAVKKYAKSLEDKLPEGVKLAPWDDRSEILEARINLLLRNGASGLLLVMLLLGCFLQVRLAFWVMMGIPISFLGSFLLFPGLDLTVNMVSLFACITALGIVVDDAIVVGENIFTYREKKYSYVDAAILGTKRVAMPVVFSILTNIVAFCPLLFVPGVMGKIFRVIPLVVIPVFVISLAEALFVLPAHLGHQKPNRKDGFWDHINVIERFFGRGMEWFIQRLYAPVLRTALRQRYVTLIIAVAILVMTLALVKSGRIGIVRFPHVERDQVVASVELPFGAPVEQTVQVQDLLIRTAEETAAELGAGVEILRGVYSQVGATPKRRGPRGGGAGEAGGHVANVIAYLVPLEQRTIAGAEVKTSDFSKRWREKTGIVPGVQSLTFQGSFGGPSSGSPVGVRLSHRDNATLEKAATELATAMQKYDGVFDIDTGFSTGKKEYSFKPREEAGSLGVSTLMLSQQLRNAFYGAEALRIQRGRDEVKVMVRLPKGERDSLFHLEQLLIRTNDGGEIPVGLAAKITLGQADSKILRKDGKRTVEVTSDLLDKGKASSVLKRIFAEDVPELQEKYPGLEVELGGDMREFLNDMVPLFIGFIIAMLAVYALLAIPFNSYLQPAIVMVSIPFGIIGAILGHLIMGYYSLSFISMMGVVALSGVVVNDSLVMVDYANGLRAAGAGFGPSAYAAGKRRFRPIILTSLTTFGGLAPMIFEESVQARFLIPMALSLGYGILFATVIALLLIPSLYLILDDITRAWKVFWAWGVEEDAADS